MTMDGVTNDTLRHVLGELTRQTGIRIVDRTALVSPEFIDRQSAGITGLVPAELIPRLHRAFSVADISMGIIGTATGTEVWGDNAPLAIDPFIAVFHEAGHILSRDGQSEDMLLAEMAAWVWALENCPFWPQEAHEMLGLCLGIYVNSCKPKNADDPVMMLWQAYDKVRQHVCQLSEMRMVRERENVSQQNQEPKQ